MIDRRTALALVGALLSRSQPQAQTSTCGVMPETLVLNFESGACRVKQIKVTQGALSATIPVSEIMTALGAKVG